MIYEQGANAVFLFGSTLRDPATAHDLDFLVSGLTYEGRTRALNTKMIDCTRIQTSACSTSIAQPNDHSSRTTFRGPIT